MDNLSLSSFHNLSQHNIPLENNKEHNISKEVVALNKVLHAELIKAKNAIESHRVIVRCDELPVIEGNTDDFEKLFKGILNLILDHPQVSGKQFLYIQCKEDPIEKNILNLSGKEKTFTLQFHTNIALETDWNIKYHPVLKECEQLAAKYNGRLIINNINSGCLFSLHLSGKPI